MVDSESNIEKLLAAARQARSGAVDRLLAAYRNYLGLLARVGIDASLRQKVDASDIVQETLLRAYDRIDQFRGQTEPEFVAWMRQILARCLADVGRRYHAASRQVHRERTLEQSIDASSSALHTLAANSVVSPSEAAAGREQGVLLANAIAQLNKDHGEVIVLRSLQELDWNEVAHRMGRSQGAVRMLWTRALIDLRAKLECSP